MPAELERGQEPAARIVLDRRAAHLQQVGELLSCHQFVPDVAEQVDFDPLTRYRRKDYLGSRLYPYFVVGRTAEEVVAALAEADIEMLEEEPSDDGDDDGTEETIKVPGLGELKPTTFKPSTAMSSDSANIFMRARRTQRFDPDSERVAHLAIRSSARWSPPGTRDPFGVALALGYSKAEIDIYEEIRARIEIEVPIELDIEG